jgi:hypothetical protein
LLELKPEDWRGGGLVSGSRVRQIHSQYKEIINSTAEKITSSSQLAIALASSDVMYATPRLVSRYLMLKMLNSTMSAKYFRPSNAYFHFAKSRHMAVVEIRMTALLKIWRGVVWRGA